MNQLKVKKNKVEIIWKEDRKATTLFCSPGTRTETNAWPNHRRSSAASEV